MEAGSESRRRRPHIALLASPGMGHLLPLAEFASLLVLRHRFTATLITYSDFSSKSQLSFLSSLPPSLSSLSLPSLPLSHLPSDARVETRIASAAALSLPSLKSALQSLPPLAAFVADIFGGVTLSVAKDLHIPPFLFFPSNFFLLSFLFHLPALHEATSCEFRDLPEPLTLPGCVPLHGTDFIDPIRDRNSDACRWTVHAATKLGEADGILVNSFEAMEPDAVRFLREKKPGRPDVFPVGPITRSGSCGDWGGAQCLSWLDNQPGGSVLFVSFGSGGTLSCNQLTELAFGLESSGQRFLWVVRTPSDCEADGAYFDDGTSNDDPLEYLPEGFLSRTGEFGMVVPNWAPQIEVLSHRSVGGFMMHCGWNSTMESVVNGVPMIAWPLYAEQRMNAVMLVEGVKVALRAEAGDDGMVKREAVCEVVKELMEGEKGKAAKERVRELQEAGVKALEEGGSSATALDEVANKWKASYSM